MYRHVLRSIVLIFFVGGCVLLSADSVYAMGISPGRVSREYILPNSSIKESFVITKGQHEPAGMYRLFLVNEHADMRGQLSTQEVSFESGETQKPVTLEIEIGDVPVGSYGLKVAVERDTLLNTQTNGQTTHPRITADMTVYVTDRPVYAYTVRNVQTYVDNDTHLLHTRFEIDNIGNQPATVQGVYGTFEDGDRLFTINIKKKRVKIAPFEMYVLDVTTPSKFPFGTHTFSLFATINKEHVDVGANVVASSGEKVWFVSSPHLVVSAFVLLCAGLLWYVLIKRRMVMTKK